MPRRMNISKQTRCVLEVLSAAPDLWRYGYDISRETGVKSGTLYPMLMRLTDQGLLEAEWREPAAPGRPARHVYRLTAEGRVLAASSPQESEPASEIAPVDTVRA